MDGNQKIVVVLLLVAILFSVVSIYISYSALNADLPYQKVSGHASSGGNGMGSVNLYVAKPGGAEGG